MMYELTILSVKDYFQCDAHLFAGTTKHVYDVRLTALSGKDHLLVYEALPAPKKKISNWEAGFGVCNF